MPYPEMTTEKLQNLATSVLSKEEKLVILQLWNSNKYSRQSAKFPALGFIDNAFNLYLQKFVWWSQLSHTSNQLFRSLEFEGSKVPNVDFEKYLKVNRIKQWDYAYELPIASKQIQKSFDVPKQLFLEDAAKRLVYR